MTKKKNKPLPDWDDGRTVCSMDIEGMPWRRERSPLLSGKKEKAAGDRPEESMSADQLRTYTFGAVKAGLLIVGIFSAALILFTLFCTKIWFGGA